MTGGTAPGGTVSGGTVSGGTVSRVSGFGTVGGPIGRSHQGTVAVAAPGAGEDPVFIPSQRVATLRLIRPVRGPRNASAASTVAAPAAAIAAAAPTDPASAPATAGVRP